MERFDWKLTIKKNIFSLWMIGLWPKDGTYKLNFYSLYTVVSISFFINVFGILTTVNMFMSDLDFEDSEELMLYWMADILTHIKVYMLSKKFQLPLQFWYPYNTKSSPFYEITYLHQAISLFYTVMAIYNIDMLIAALMIFIGAQCDILSDKLRNFESNSLITSIKHHQEILISVILSLVLYRLALDKILDIKLFTNLIIVVFYMIQIFTYCWFGNEVEVKSNQIPHSIYESDWTRHSLREKKNIMMLLLKSKKPIKLSAYNLFYLSLETFIK
ncbi:7tm 6 domain containing protein, partial [Asbolus verrucosus]